MVDPVTPRRKLKWTLPEEAALKSGVNKHGAGKWKNIVSDPEFGPCLVSRTNVDLKDKWRNMSGQSSYRPKVKLAPTTTSSKSPSKSASCNPADVKVYTEAKRQGKQADCVPAVIEIIDCFENSRKQDVCDESTVSDAGASEGSLEVSSDRSCGESSGMVDNSCNISLGASAKRKGPRHPFEVLVAAIESIDSHDLVRVSEEPTADILVPDNPKENKLVVPNFLRKRFRERPPQNHAIQKKAVKKFKSSTMVDSSNFETLMMAVNYVSKNDNDEPAEEKETHSLLDNAEKQSEAVLVNKSVAVSSGIHQVLDDMSACSAEDRSLRIRKLTSFKLSILPEGNTLVSDQSLGIKKLTSFKLGTLQENNTSKVCSSYKGFSRRNNDQQRVYMSAEKSCREQCLLMANSRGGNMGGCENRQTSNMTSEQQRLQKTFCWRERRKRLDAEAEAYILKDRRRQHSFLLQHSSTNSQKLQAPPAIMGQHVKSECQVLGHDTSVKISSNGFPSYNEKGFAQTVCDRSASQKATQQRRRASLSAKKSAKKLEEHQCLLKRLRRRFLGQNDVGMGQMRTQTTSRFQMDPIRPEFELLDSTGLEYHRWVSDVETTFVAKDYTSTIKPSADAAPGTEKDKAHALMFLMRHINPNLRWGYHHLKTPKELWGALHSRFGNIHDSLIPQLNAMWNEIRFLGYVKFNDFQKDMLQIQARMNFCGKKLTDEEMIQKPYQPFSPCP